jgi:hypothetical protein
MKHLSEENLILHYYRETDASEHLNGCGACRAELVRLTATLDALHAYQVPERGEGYEALVWQRLAPELRTRQVAWWKQPLIFGPLLASLVVGAFFAGRISTGHRASAPLMASAISDEGRLRILQMAMGDHLERSQVVLVEAAHAQDQGETVQFRERAQQLVFENRLYRQTAAQTGDGEFNALLDEMGRVLTDIANGPAELSGAELERIQRLLFKIRVVGNNLQHKGNRQL